MAYKIAHLDEIDELDDGRCPYRPIRHHLGITAFGATSWTARAAGDRIINEHTEDDGDGHEELYVVLNGHAVFEIDGVRTDAPTGTCIYIEPDAKRTAFAEEAGTTILVVGGTRGQAYVAHGWELWASVRRLYEAGDYAGVADQGQALLAANPDYPLLFYNVACCESLAGRTDEALEHLRVAVEGAEMFRDYAKGDSDFDAIRGEPGFTELAG